MDETKPGAVWSNLHVRVTSHSGWSNYRAWGDGIEFRGTTLGYWKEVIELLHRMVRAKAEPPSAVVKAANVLFEHIEAYLRHDHFFGDNFIGTAVDVEDPEAPYLDFTLYMDVAIKNIDVVDLGREDVGEAEPGRYVVIAATYEGYDGGGEGKHTVKRKLVFKGRIDRDVLREEFFATIRRAVNALPTG
jgi:hypothetical protein